MSWSFWSALFDTVETQLEQDYRNDPVYKAKVQELIERNKAFEQERKEEGRASGSGAGSNEQST